MNKKIIVTGGAGFIGSHLIKRLLEGGHEVYCIDDLYTGSPENIREFMDSGRFHFVEHDITEPLELEADQIYNLACPASPVHYQKDPIKTLHTSYMGAYNMLTLAKNTGARILQTSTSEVYGDPKEHPQKESYWGNVNPIGIRSCYDEGKRAAETLFFDFHREYGVNIKVVRLFNSYGPKMSRDDGRVVSNFIIQALKGNDLTVYGDGTQTRSFCYVDDTVECIIRMMNNNEEGFTGPVNIGNPNELTIRELAEKIISLTGSSSKIVYRPLPGDDPTRRRPDISLAKQKLGWEPSFDLDMGLRNTIEYFRNICG